MKCRLCVPIVTNDDIRVIVLLPVICDNKNCVYTSLL